MENKIVINSSILNENPTGLGVYTKNVIEKIYKLNDKIEILSPVDIKEIKVKKINRYVSPNYKKLGGACRFLWTQLVIPFKVKKDDILYHPFQYISFFARSKQIITIHDFIPLYYPEIAKHQYKYYKYIMPILLKKAYKIVCISENTKKDLLKFYNVDEDKVKVIYNGYDNKLFNTKNVSKDVLKKYNINYKYMIMIGASYPHKNLEIAIEALKNIKEDFKLVIVGKDSSYILKLKALARKLNVEEKVNFVGYVADEDLPSLYYYSKAFIYTTLYEGFGLPILEAMACGTVVLCSDNSSLPEVYGDAALVFENNNSKSLEEKMNLILKNEEIRQALIKKSFENVKRFSWEKTSLDIYNLMI